MAHNSVVKMNLACLNQKHVCETESSESRDTTPPFSHIFDMGKSNLTLAKLLTLLRLGIISAVSAIDEEKCEYCVDRGCGYCAVDGVESCVYDAFTFESGSQFNGGSKSVKTTAKFACSESGRKALIAIAIILPPAIIALSILDMSVVAFVTKDIHIWLMLRTALSVEMTNNQELRYRIFKSGRCISYLMLSYSFLIFAF